MKKYKITFRDGSSVIVNAKDASVADVYNEIKRAYPNANVQKSIKNGPNYSITTFKVMNVAQMGNGFNSFMKNLARKYSQYEAYTTQDSIVLVEEK